MTITSPSIVLKWPPPTVAQAEAIATLTDAVLRNLQITQSYHEFTVAMAQLLGEANVTWCAYGTWASRTAGAFIRQENVQALTRQYLAEADFIEERLASLQRVLSWFNDQPSLKDTFVAQAINSVPNEISRHIGEGNMKVFAELGPLFARMIEWFAQTTEYNQAELDDFLAHIRPGPAAEGGQEMLHRAFSHYYQAMFAPDAKTRAEHILCANLLVGFHEQTRLQPQIIAGMEAPLDNDFEKEFLWRTYTHIEKYAPRGISRLIQFLWRRRLKKVSRKIADDWRVVTTQMIMTIELAAETLRLGQDVPPLSSGDLFPGDLAALNLADLVTLLAQVDRSPDSVLGSSARDWGNLQDRMNFIADLFRSRQQDASLYQQPFSDSQVTMIHSGVIPPEPL